MAASKKKAPRKALGKAAMKSTKGGKTPSPGGPVPIPYPTETKSQ